MRKLMIVLTLAVSFLAATGTMSADFPPACSPNCPGGLR